MTGYAVRAAQFAFVLGLFAAPFVVYFAGRGVYLLVRGRGRRVGTVDLIGLDLPTERLVVRRPFDWADETFEWEDDVA